MKGITVQVRPATQAGRLHSRYDEESGILAVESRFERPWPYGIDVDGTLIFDLDEERILANFDLHVPRRLWTKDLAEATPPMVAVPGNLQFTEQAVAHKSFHLPLRVASDARMRRVRIELGSIKPDRAIALSDSCIVLLAQDELTGFLISGLE